MHFYIANRVGWEHLSMFSTFSQKFIIRFFDLVNCLVLLHRIFNTLRLINYYVIFQKYFTEYHNYNSRKTYFPSTYPSIESPFSFFFHIQFLNSNNSNPKQYPKHQTIVLPIIYTLFLPYIYIHSIEQLISLKIRKKGIPSPPTSPRFAFHIQEILLITALYKPGTAKPVTIEKFRMARITPSKAAPCGCDTWPGQGCAALVDAIAPLYACAHWKPMHITLKAITSPRRPVIIASLACSTREARVDCVMT